MMTAPGYSGRCAMFVRMKWFACLVLIAAAVDLHAQEAAPPPEPEAVGPGRLGAKAEAPYLVLKEWAQHVRWLDPAIFTDISPIPEPERGIRLPPDQEE